MKKLQSISAIFFLALLLLGCEIPQQLPETSGSEIPEKPCAADARVCPDGSAVGRQGPDCEFAPCPSEEGKDDTDQQRDACPEDARVCPDGTILSRKGANCEFPPCPESKCELPECILDIMCAPDTKTCPDGTVLSREGVNCEFPICPNTPPDILCAHGDEGCPVDKVKQDPPTEKKAGAGETISTVLPGHLTECQEGLTVWSAGFDTRISVGDGCYETELVAGAPISICLDCGNGICEDIETPCNCPKDCKNGQNADFADVESFCKDESWQKKCKLFELSEQGYEIPGEKLCRLCK